MKNNYNSQRWGRSTLVGREVGEAVYKPILIYVETIG